jgi:hypothetical protein
LRKSVSERRVSVILHRAYRSPFGDASPARARRRMELFPSNGNFFHLRVFFALK